MISGSNEDDFTCTVYGMNVYGLCAGVHTYLRVIRSKTYRGYVKPRIIPNAIDNVIFVVHT
jgi:hypothetical protein